ncbi:30S ribosomal protein S17 [Candidatus Vidania fulgoroideae]|uniref:30S ribosomal protein S17 n=1 Tax=Candidatus Vidania fulgoroideorum TaxID=881286 RepID=A0A974X7F7_9PROT|nr:30S ribosomal protein S17 [Candidatus Vidania fulgoroideae]
MVKIICKVSKICSRNTISVEFNTYRFNKKLREKFSKKKKLLVDFSSTLLEVGNIISIRYIGKKSKLKSWQLLKILK